MDPDPTPPPWVKYQCSICETDVDIPGYEVSMMGSEEAVHIAGVTLYPLYVSKIQWDCEWCQDFTNHTPAFEGSDG